ncbi:thioesterase family protein [Microbacterium sp. G2-8]|uniref:thioesterase family protein n=1 Tax=Microbacterium sp. G2-8 TaxID=2842454 RepID=UPI001C8AB560|nr:thioesterase family protein [Microbacterium sp. G2-8]
MTTEASSYYTRVDDDVFRPTLHAQGAWSDDEIHFANLAGLLLHELERRFADLFTAGFVASRLAYEILGVPALDDCRVSSRVVRPGRTIQLVELEVAIGSRTAGTLRAWLLASRDTADRQGTPVDPLPSPAEATPFDVAGKWGGGFIRSVEGRELEEGRPGRHRAWLRPGYPLVEGEESGPLASFGSILDVANGIAVREGPDTLAFPNVDMTVHLARAPKPGWVGFDTSVTFGPTGQGVTHTVLHDETGHVGYISQSLTVRPMA